MGKWLKYLESKVAEFGQTTMVPDRDGVPYDERYGIIYDMMRYGTPRSALLRLEEEAKDSEQGRFWLIAMYERGFGAWQRKGA